MENNIDNPLPLRYRGSKNKEPARTGDRFIPTRMPSSETPEHLFEHRTPEAIAFEERYNSFSSKLTPQISRQPTRKSILFFGSPEQNCISSNLEQQFSFQNIKKPLPKVSFEKLRICDAPDVSQNFYNNVLAWSTSDRVSIALDSPEGGSIFSISPNHRTPIETVTSPEPLLDQSACSLASLDGETTVSGWDNGFIRLHQSGTNQKYHYQNCVSSEPIRSIAVTGTQTIMCGDEYGVLRSVDLRTKAVSAYTALRSSTLGANKIAGLTYDGGHYLASGSNSNVVSLWDMRALNKGPAHTNTTHKAGVKALVFWPLSKQYLISGGDKDCRSLCLWNVSTDKIKYKLDTGSQITGIHCFKHDPRYFVTSHGFNEPSIKLWHIANNQISLQLSHALSIPNQNNRALALTGSPNTNDFATVTDSEALHFFKPNGLNGSTLNTAHKSTGLPPELPGGPVIR